MSRCVTVGVRTFGAVAAVMMSVAASSVAAQTTVKLGASDTFIRGGSHANTVFNTDGLATKANSNISNVRRSLLKFDTETTMPKGSAIQSAKLTLTLKHSDPQTRKIGVYRIATSYQKHQATWNTRKAGYRWTSAGGDLSSKIAEFSVGTAPGSKVTIDITSLVRQTVAGSYGSRYTRVALVDIGSGSDTSYKEFYSSRASNTANRPVLTVAYGSGGSSSPAPAPAPAPSTSGSRLRVLDWNTHYGVGTDGRYNIDRIASKIASFNPDVVSLNEVTRYSHYNANEDQASRYAAMLRAKTGRSWYYYFRTDNGASKGVGNMVLSRFPIASTSYCQLSSRRVAVKAAIYVNGRLVNVWSTHLDSSSGNSGRLAEIRNLKSCMSGFAEQKIVAGDFNAQPTTTEIGQMKTAFYDGWAEAKADGTATDFPGNTRDGATRNTRIDYVFYSRGASRLALRSAQVYDTRDSSGVRPSDHKPLMAVFDVR